jgi:hypothetical protein
MLGLWLLVGWTGLSVAGPFTHKTTQGEAPATQVARRLVMPRGWLELGIRSDTKASEHHRLASGVRRSHPGRWRYSRLWLDVRQGFSRRITLFGSMPWVMAELSPEGGTVTRTLAMGDAEVGLVAEPWTWESAGLGFQADLKAPSGVEWPGTVGSGPDQVSSFLTGTGITNVGGHLLGRATVAERLKIRLSAGYVAKLPGVVGYVIQDDGFANGWLDPGDEIRLDGELTGQVLTSLAVSTAARWSRRSAYEIGVSGPGTTRRTMTPLPGGAGVFVDGRVGLSYQPTSHWEVHAHAARDLAGSDTRTFAHLGLEEFSPQPGLEFGLGVRARW